jgi:hypothetical protein
VTRKSSKTFMIAGGLSDEIWTVDL